MEGLHVPRTSEGVLVLENRHTGEVLRLRRLPRADSGFDLELKGSLPPHSEGPPLHLHLVEEERGEVVSGTLSASVDGVVHEFRPGSKAAFPPGSAHRWWNAGHELLRFEGRVSPVVDLDRFLQAMFDVANAGPDGRPSLFYMVHALHRHRKTQVAVVVPPALQRVLFPVVIALGRLLGKYRGTDWPGCPARCTGAPTALAGEV